MGPTVNELTGEVSVTLGGVAFTLDATLPNVAALMADLKITGLRQLQIQLGLSDPRVTYSGMKCLCSSGNRDEVEKIKFPVHGVEALEAVTLALVAGMPESDGEPGKS